jgi:hypothetical protein
MTDLLKSRPHPCLTGSANAVARPFPEILCIFTLCQLRKLVVHIVEYTVLFALTIKQARFEQFSRHIYLLLKKKKHSNLET